MRAVTGGGIHLFLGPDRSGKLQRVHALARSLGIQPFDRHHLDAAATTSAALVALCRQQPAASSVRFIVVDAAHRLDKACVEALLHHAAVIAENACLILLVETELSFRHALTQALQRSDTQASGQFRTERFSGSRAPAVKPFALTDALGAGDVRAALAALHEQRLVGKEPLEVLGLVSWQLQRWVAIKRLCEAGYTAERMASVTGLRLWQVQRSQSEVARRPLGWLQQMLTRCWQFDVGAKRGRTIPDLGLEQLVVELCSSPARQSG